MAADSSTSIEKRRVSKPLIEKRRRARINSSLAQLKEIVAKPIPKSQESRSNRLEKADILEMTVEYVKKINRKNGIEVPECPSSEPPSSLDLNHSFEEGYRLCMTEVDKFLSNKHLRHTTDDFLSQDLRKYLQQMLYRSPSNSRSSVIASSDGHPSLKITSTKELFTRRDKASRKFQVIRAREDKRFDLLLESSSRGSSNSLNSTDDEMSESLYVEHKAKEITANSCSTLSIPKNFVIESLNASESMWRPW